MLNYDLVPPDHYEKSNPTALPYLYPTTLNITSYNRQLQSYNNNQMLVQLQKVAKQFDCLVVPSEVLHWRRKKEFTDNGQRYRISNNAYFLVKYDDLTNSEKNKLKNYIEELSA